MWKSAPAVIALLAACTPRFECEDVPLPEARRGVDLDPSLDALDADIQDLLHAYCLPGAAVGVVRDGEVVWTTGYGVRDTSTGDPVLTSTPFSLASVSKSFIAVATMQAVEDGLVTLDTPVDDLVDFDLDNPKLDGETISLVHLATHTAGIRDTREYDRAYVMGDPEVGLGEFVEGYLVPGGEWYHDRSWRSWEPGDEASYSNVGAALAAHALEGATATPFEDLTHDQIFAPLGMEHTAWFLADLDEAEVAMPHEWSGGAYEPYGHYGFPTWPDGQLRSSVDDLSRYLAAIQAGGELDGVRILDQASVDEMLSDQAPEVMEGHGVFWYEQQREGRTTWGHSGGDFGVMTEMFFDREAGVGVVFMLHAIPPVFRAYEDYVLLYEDILAAAE